MYSEPFARVDTSELKTLPETKNAQRENVKRSAFYMCRFYKLSEDNTVSTKRLANEIMKY